MVRLSFVKASRSASTCAAPITRARMRYSNRWTSTCAQWNRRHWPGTRARMIGRCWTQRVGANSAVNYWKMILTAFMDSGEYYGKWF